MNDTATLSAPQSGAAQIGEPFEETRGPHWVSRAAFPVLTGILALNQLCLWASIYYGHFWLKILFVLTGSHLMHGQLIAFHEASHGLLRKSRLLNEIDGVLIGAFSLMSFSLYRAAHQAHHVRLGTERDEEFWPFVVPTIPRWKRVLAAMVELNLGILFTPYVFLRMFLRPGSSIRSKKVRRRIWQEFGLTAVLWIFLISAVTWFGVWKYALWMHFIPAVLAGNQQSWRKYIEHIGMTGPTINSCTRSIVAEGWFGKLIAFTLLHEPFHGVHHRHAGLPHLELPNHTHLLEPKRPDELPPFRSYAHAMVHLCRSLGNPRMGAQWHAEPSTGASSPVVG